MRKLNTLAAAGFAAAVMLASSFGAQAVTVTNLGNNHNPGAPTTNPVGVTVSGTVNYGLTSSNLVPTSEWRSPFESTANPNLEFTSVQGNSSGLWSFGGFMDTLSLIWGSPDNYNIITFFASADGSGTALGSVFNSYITPPGPTAIENALVQITDIGFFQSILISSSQNSFEFANLIASCAGCQPETQDPGETPIPGAAFLMGSVIAGVGGMQVMRRRRRKAAA